MIKNDRVYGVPLVQYKDTKANIEALSGIGEGAIAYATDSNEFGSYDGTTWTWGQSGSTAPATTAANDFQVGDGSGNWIKKTLAETITILRTALDSVYAALSHTHVAGDVSWTNTSISISSSNISAAIWTRYFVDLSGLTADRDFNLPTPTAVGDEIELYVNAGDDTYELIVKINSTEWSRVFITNEVVKFVAFGTGAGDWQISYDGRIPCKTVFHRITSSITTNTAATDTIADWNYLDVDVGNMGDLTNNRANIRRAGHYICGGGYAPGASIADGKYANIVVYKNGTSGTRVQSSAARQSTAGGAASAIFGSVLSPLTHLCAAGDYLEYWYKTEEADRGLLATDHSGAGSAVIKGMSFFSVIEVIR